MIVKDKIKIAVYGALTVCCVIWCIVGSSVVKPDSSGEECFFLLTLPLLGAVAAAVSCVVAVFRHKRNKNKPASEREDTIIK